MSYTGPNELHPHVTPQLKSWLAWECLLHVLTLCNFSLLGKSEDWIEAEFIEERSHLGRRKYSLINFILYQIEKSLKIVTERAVHKVLLDVDVNDFGYFFLA